MQRNRIPTQQLAVNAFSCGDFFNSRQKRMKFQPQVLKLHRHTHEDNFKTKDKFTTKKGKKADTAGITTTPDFTTNT